MPWREKMLKDGVWKGPIMDQHIHLDRENRFLDAVSDFVQAGGTSLMLVHKPSFSNSLPIDLVGYREAYSDTISMANEVREKFSIDVGVVLGPHPVVWEKQIKKLGLEKSTNLHLEAVGLALDFIDSGEANCLGEVGRPHYKVNEETWEAANELLIQVLSLAASSGAPVQLHVEENGKQTCKQLSNLCRKAGFPKERAIRHFAPPNVSAEFTSGLPATVNVGRDSIESLAATLEEASSTWGMETDYLDDPLRPGAVLGPRTIPKRTNQLCTALSERGWSNGRIEDLIFNIHEDWPRSLYSL